MVAVLPTSAARFAPTLSRSEVTERRLVLVDKLECGTLANHRVGVIRSGRGAGRRADSLHHRRDARSAPIFFLKAVTAVQ